jgi:hypothetical protein
MPDDSPSPSTHRQLRAGERVGYLSRDQRWELELLDQLFRSPELVVRFRLRAKTMDGYQAFATGTMWHLATLAQRGWVELVERTMAKPEQEQWWEAVAVVLTLMGRTNYLVLRARAAQDEEDGVGERSSTYPSGVPKDLSFGFRRPHT